MNLKALFTAITLSLLTTFTIADDKKEAEKPAAEATTEKAEKDSKDADKADKKEDKDKKEEKDSKDADKTAKKDAKDDKSAQAADAKPTLNADVDAELKTLIEAAATANEAAKKAGFEWYWANQPASDHLNDAIKAANAGDKEKAMKTAKLVKIAGEQGQLQAEAAKTVKPRI